MEFWNSPTVSESPFVDFTLLYSSTSRAAGYDGHNVWPNDASPILSHLNGDCMAKTALCSAVSVLAPHDNFAVAEDEVKTWMVANFRRKLQSAHAAGRHDTNGLVEPCIITHGEQLHVYLAYTDPAAEHGAKVVRLESEGFELCHTSDEAGVWRILRLFRNLFVYAIDEGPGGYMGGFLRVILERLVVPHLRSPAASGVSSAPHADLTRATPTGSTPMPAPELPAKSPSPATERVTISLLCD